MITNNRPNCIKLPCWPAHFLLAPVFLWDSDFFLFSARHLLHSINRSLTVCNKPRSTSFGFTGDLVVGDDGSESLKTEEFPEMVLGRLGGKGGGSSDESSTVPCDENTTELRPKINIHGLSILLRFLYLIAILVLEIVQIFSKSLPQKAFSGFY